VILISSAINGLNSNIDTFVKSLGTNDLWVFRFEPFGKRPTTEELNRKQMTYEDGIAMRSLPYVVAVDPGLTYQNFQTGLGSVSIKAGTHKISNTILNGSTSQVKETQDIEMLEGRMWTDAEEERRANVVVLGHDAAKISSLTSLRLERTSIARATSLPSSAFSMSSRSRLEAAATPGQLRLFPA